MTSDAVTSLTDFPKSIVILGAGVIGCEFATIFSNFGKTNVSEGVDANYQDILNYAVFSLIKITEQSEV